MTNDVQDSIFGDASFPAEAPRSRALHWAYSDISCKREIVCRDGYFAEKYAKGAKMSIFGPLVPYSFCLRSSTFDSMSDCISDFTQRERNTKRSTKSAIAVYARESNEQSSKRLLRQMAWNDFSISLKDLINGEDPAQHRANLTRHLREQAPQS